MTIPETLQIERREATAPEVREGETPTLTGYAALYNVEADIGGLFRERIAAGAFDAAIGRDDVRALWNHDPNIVLGRTPKTLRLRSDERGLAYEIDLNPADPDAVAVLARIRRGDVSQSSFAFRVKNDDWTKPVPGQPRTRTILDVELFDVSPVTYPAYTSTSVSARAQDLAQQTCAPPAALPASDGDLTRWRAALTLTEVIAATAP